MKLKFLSSSERVVIANSFFKRVFGLMGRKILLPGEVWIFPHCRQVHTFGMRFPIDIAFLDGDGAVQMLYEAVKPWKVVKGTKNTKITIECGAGEFKKIYIASIWTP